MEDFKEALRKTEGTTTSKKNDPRPGVDSQKGQDKRRGEDKRARSPKKQKNGPLEKNGPLPKYANYHPLTASLDRVYAMTDRSVYRSPKRMKEDRVCRDIKRNCAFHKDIGHITDKCVALKDEIKRLIRLAISRSLWMNPRQQTERSDLDNGAQKEFARC